MEPDRHDVPAPPPDRPTCRDDARFHAHETARADELDGVRLATFHQRAFGFAVDFAVVSALRGLVSAGWRHLVPHAWERYTRIDFTHVLSAAVFVAYFTIVVYLDRGRTPGKRIARTAVVSLTGTRPTLWQSFERTLGYGASAVEAGLGFLQFFRSRNRQCAHDRLAETIVVDLRASGRATGTPSAASGYPACAPATPAPDATRSTPSSA